MQTSEQMELESKQTNAHIPQTVSTASTEPPPLSRDDKRRMGWRYLGYREFSKFAASSDDFCVVRRFSQVGARVLMRMQDEISELEFQIEELDNRSMNGTTNFDRIDSFRIDREQCLDRNERMDELTTKLKDYYDFISAFTEIKARPEAQSHQIGNIKNWFISNQDAIELRERKFIDAEGDLIALVARPRSLLYRGLEEVSLIRYLFRESPRGDRVNCESTEYFSDRRLELSAAMGVLIVGLALLLGPMWVLGLVHSSLDKLVIITAFVVGFAVLFVLLNHKYEADDKL